MRRLDPIFRRREPETVQITEDESTGHSPLPLSVPPDRPLSFAAAAMLAYLLYVALAAEF